jgi:hypothetical protein
MSCPDLEHNVASSRYINILIYTEVAFNETC